MAVSAGQRRWSDLFAARTRAGAGDGIAAILGLVGNPDLISFAGGLPDPSTFPAEKTAELRDGLRRERLDEAKPVGDDVLTSKVEEGTRLHPVADTVEAMSSHRPYRPAFGIAAALEEIDRGAGKAYDAQAAAACLRLFREKNYHLPG